MDKRLPLAALIAGSLLTSSCAQLQEDISKAGVGGAAIFAILGDRFCGEKHRGACIAGSAVLGYTLGHALERYLDKEDKAKRAKALDQAVSKGGGPHTWSNPETGNSGTVTVIANKQRKEQNQVKVLKGAVKTVPPTDLIGELYRVKSSSKVRGGPSTEYVELGRQMAGNIVHVYGKVRGKNWYSVQNKGVIVGYIHGDLLEKMVTTDNQPAPQPTPQPELAVAQLESSTVDVSIECNTVQENITVKNGESGTQQVTLCRGPNGWSQV